MPSPSVIWLKVPMCMINLYHLKSLLQNINLTKTIRKKIIKLMLKETKRSLNLQLKLKVSNKTTDKSKASHFWHLINQGALQVKSLKCPVNIFFKKIFGNTRLNSVFWHRAVSTNWNKWITNYVKILNQKILIILLISLLLLYRLQPLYQCSIVL